MRPPAFQFYADDFLAGTVTFDHAQRGLYITLLCIQWNAGYVTPDDFESLTNGTAIAEPLAKRVWAKFKEGSDGHFRNERMEFERNKQLVFRENRQKSGVLGANTRWHSHSTAIAQPMANHMANDSFPSPSPSPSPTVKVKRQSFSSKKLSVAEKDLSDRIEFCMNGQWVNDAGKWINRIKQNFAKSERVIFEVESGLKEKRIRTTAAQYAEQIWKEFK